MYEDVKEEVYAFGRFQGAKRLFDLRWDETTVLYCSYGRVLVSTVGLPGVTGGAPGSIGSRQRASFISPRSNRSLVRWVLQLALQWAVVEAKYLDKNEPWLIDNYWLPFRSIPCLPTKSYVGLQSADGPAHILESDPDCIHQVSPRDGCTSAFLLAACPETCLELSEHPQFEGNEKLACTES